MDLLTRGQKKGGPPPGVGWRTSTKSKWYSEFLSTPQLPFIHHTSPTRTQAHDAHEQLEWGLDQFDEKMGTWMVNSRRANKHGKRTVPADFWEAKFGDEEERPSRTRKTKAGVKRKSSKRARARSSSEEDDDISADDDTEERRQDEDDPVILQNGSKISVYDSQGEEIGYGDLLDAEPAYPGLARSHTRTTLYVMYMPANVSI